jgi:chromate transporter
MADVGFRNCRDSSDRGVSGAGSESAQPGRRGTLAELAKLFLKLGTTAFGGPAAHIAMMEDEVVRRRRWLTREAFLDYVGVTNLIPGPNSTELAIHLGHARAGWPGLFVAGGCFILPSALMVGVLAWVYVHFGTLPAAEGVLYGVKPVVIAVVLQALWGLARTALKSQVLLVLGVVALAAAAVGVHELVILACAGALMVLLQRARSPSGPRAGMPALFVAAGSVGAGGGNPPRVEPATVTAMAASAAGTIVAAATPFGLWPLFAVFLKVGALLFGSGYVLLAFLRADLVERLGWLTERQLLDAVAVGQITPGPVFTTATFIGYVLGGGVGAVVATLGIFFPAFVFVALSGLALPRLRHSPTARAVLDGINVASLALMAVVTVQLGRSALVDPLTLIVTALSAVALVRFRVNSAWLVLAGAAIGVVITLISPQGS